MSKESRRKQLAPFSVLVNQVVDDLSVPQRVKRSLTSSKIASLFKQRYNFTMAQELDRRKV